MSFSPKKLQGLPIFQDASGYWARPTLKSGSRAWRKLDAGEVTDAIVEWKSLATQHEAYLAGNSATSPWEQSTETLEGLAKLYLAARCPNKEDQPRDESYCKDEARRIEWLIKRWGKRHPNEIRFRDLMPYFHWRKEFCQRGTGERIVELEWVTLSNIMTYGLIRGVVDVNWVRSRPCLRKNNPGSVAAKRIRHAREVAPRNGDEVHAIAESMMRHPESQPAAWAWMFACLTGLRRSELLRLRVDAADKEPGYSDDKYLWVKRSKRALDNTVLLYPDLEELLREHFQWHQLYAPANPFFFPGEKDSIRQSTLNKVLTGTCVRLKLPHFTPHGARSFFATKLRSDRLPEAEVAARIGDKTVHLIQTTYGGNPYYLPKPLSFRPEVGLPVWLRWRELGAYTHTLSVPNKMVSGGGQ